MNDDERALGREILDDVGAVLRDELAADAWGRILVEVVRARDGQPMVAGIDVEEVLDDARVDAVFGGEASRGVVPVLAKAVEALCAIEDVDLDDVRGGTFVRIAETNDFAFLPGLVHAPSPALDRDRGALLRTLREKNDDLLSRFGFPDAGRPEIDLVSERLRFVRDGRPVARARATLLGTFAPESRTWGWGGSHPNAPDAVRAASARVVDEILDREAWELSTPVFATDEPTAWLLVAFVAERTRADGVLVSREAGGLVFFLLRDFAAL